MQVTLLLGACFMPSLFGTSSKNWGLFQVLTSPAFSDTLNIFIFSKAANFDSPFSLPLPWASWREHRNCLYILISHSFPTNFCFLSGHPAVLGDLNVKTVQTICFFPYWRNFSLYIRWAWQSPPSLDDLNVSRWSGLYYHHVIPDQKFSISVCIFNILSCVPCLVQCWGLIEIFL